MAFVVLAVGFITAAVVGAFLVAVDVMPEPFLALLVFGMALLAAGLSLHFFQDRLAPTKAGTPAPATIEPSDPVEGRDASASALNVRRALREVREELTDNHLYMARVRDGEPAKIEQLSTAKWSRNEPVLLELPDPVPHSAASHAYRELRGMTETRYIIESSTTMRRRNQPIEPLETDIQTTLEAIDAAMVQLRAAEAP